MATPLAVLDAAAVRAWFEHALRSLLLVRRQVDRLNAFPVPDADTGTNIVLTLAGAAEAVRALDGPAELATLTRTAADGALLGARGSSGVIVGQCLQALAETFAGADEAGPELVARALDAAARQARDAVGHPVEDTILTVARAAADAAVRHAPGADLAGTVRAASAAARDGLAGTRGAHGGALDAGAAGYVVLLSSLVDVVEREGDTGTRRADAVAAFLAAAAAPPDGADVPAAPPVTATAAEDAAEGAGDFEVMYVLRADGARAATLRDALGDTGHSVAVVGWSDATGTGLWQVHVHTDTPLTALAEPEAMEQVCVRYLRPLLAAADDRPAHGHSPEDAARTGVVACTRAPGLLEPLARTGAVAVLAAGAGPAGLRRAAADTGAAEVLILPCDETTAAAAQEAAAAIAAGRVAPHVGHQAVTVAPTRNDVHVLAAAVEVAPGAAQAGHPAAALAEQAVRRTRTAEVGDADGALAAALAEMVRPADELVTALLGAGADEEAAEQVRTTVAQVAPQAEVVVVRGGQPAPVVVLGVE
ncbi:DAK2 domain-containing protein [Georgenia sp. AZ-5]|uniref:DAK2 domain-containing protein n=1 Tax=Georgenia sp. AZ-5 TaxID=3367526 RepID=UPI003754E049